MRLRNRDHDAWLAWLAPAIMGGRQMQGWVRALPEAYAHDDVRERLLEAAIKFNRSLPKKHVLAERRK